MYTIKLSGHEVRAIRAVASWGYCEALLDALYEDAPGVFVVSEVDAWEILSELDSQDGDYTAHFGPVLAAKIERLIAEFV
jgi:hypothetical protein